MNVKHIYCNNSNLYSMYESKHLAFHLLRLSLAYFA